MDPWNFSEILRSSKIYLKRNNMPTLSNNHLDVLSWIRKMIENSETISHLKCCENLINNFEKLYFRKGHLDSRHESFHEAQNLRNFIIKKEFKVSKKK